MKWKTVVTIPYILLLLISPLRGATVVINSFNKGELSPLLEGRSDVRAYYSGCRTLENMVVLPYGGVTKRPGSYYIAAAKYSTGGCFVIPFEHSVDQAYMLEVGHEYIRFYRNGGQILEGTGTEDLSSLGNIIGHWLLNEDDGTLVADDDGNTHDGTASVDCSTLNAEGKVGVGCFDLDGSYTVEMSDHSDFSFTDDSDDSAFSLTCWTKVVREDLLQVLLSKWRDSSSTREWRFSLDGEQKLQLHLADTSATLESDRVAQWKLNEDAANKTVLDEDATSHDGLTQTDNTEDLTATGKLGTCLDFGGADAVLITNDHAELSFGDGTDDSAFSITAWAYVTEGGGTGRILTKWNTTSGSEYREWLLSVNANEELFFNLCDESANAIQQKKTDDTLSAGWHLVVATYSGVGGDDATDGMNLYVDNVIVAQSAIDTGTYVAMENTATKVIIGGSYITGAISYFWDDKLDNVTLFDKELTTADVASLWNDGAGTESLSGVTPAPYAVTDDTIPPGWHFLGVTYSAPSDATTAADGIILYVDGAAVDSTATNDSAYTAMQDGAEEIRIGSQRNSADNANECFLEDKIDSVAVFGDVLTPAEVTDLYIFTTPYEIETAYDGNDVSGLQFIQSADMMYLVHPDYPQRSLTRAAHDDWTLSAITFAGGPFLDENETTTTITPSATTGTTTLTASTAIFNRNHVGALWQVTHISPASEVSGSHAAVGDSSTVTIQKGRSYNLTTHGTWTGTVLLQRSYDSGSTWNTVVSASSVDDYNLDEPGSEDVEEATYRVRMSARTSGTVTYTLLVYSFELNGIVTISSFTSPTEVAGTVTSPSEASTATLGGTTATKYWAEGAWSDDEGYPSCLAFYEERQVFAASDNSPQTLWFSQTDDWDNFLAGAEDTDAMTITIAADQINTIQWIVPQTALLLGTSGGEWKLSATGSEEAITPTNISARRQSSHGSAAIQAIAMNDLVLYVQRQDRKIRKLQYSFDQDVWLAPDMTILSEHITEGGIVQLALQRNPYPILWGVRGDGALIGLTLEEDQEVIGWHRHEFGGDVESAAIIPGTAEDELWILIERTIDGSTVKYIEQGQPFDWGTDQSDCFFVDSGLSWSGGSAITISGVTRAYPTVVTATAHGLSDGDQIRFSDVVGMTELNNNVYSVGTVVDVNSFQLRDATDAVGMNSVGFTAYTSGGEAINCENAFTGMTHLEGETVSVLGDGGYDGTVVVSTGAITLTDYYTDVHVGLPYTAKLRPMKLESPAAPGTLFATTKRIMEATLRLHETLACDIGTSWTTYDSIVFRDADDLLEAATPLYSGDKDILFAGDYELSGDVYIQNRIPVPLTVLALKVEFESYE